MNETEKLRRLITHSSVIDNNYRNTFQTRYESDDFSKIRNRLNFGAKQTHSCPVVSVADARGVAKADGHDIKFKRDAGSIQKCVSTNAGGTYLYKPRCKDSVGVTVECTGISTGIASCESHLGTRKERRDYLGHT